MSRLRWDSPNRAAARVAGVATAVAAVIFALAAAGLITEALADLDRQVDFQLVERLHFLQARPQFLLVEGPPRRGPADRAAPATVSWLLPGDGTEVVFPAEAPPLPLAYQSVQGPVDATIQGHRFRVVGGPAGDGWLVVGVETGYLGDTARSLALAAISLGLPVLLLTFLAAFGIGRWSAEPIDRARRRVLDFTANASHELRTPLQVIEAEVSLALMQERDAASYRETIEGVGRESLRLRRMVDDLLWLARFDSHPGRPKDALIDLWRLAADGVERFQAPTRQRRQTLELLGVGPDRALLQAPPEWLDHLLGVLLDNACRYTPEGGAIRVAVEAQDGQVGLRVEDSGPGIPPPERARVMERFQRASEQGGGAGLGLAIGAAVVAATRGGWRIGDSPLGGASMAVIWSGTRPGRPSADSGARLDGRPGGWLAWRPAPLRRR